MTNYHEATETCPICDERITRDDVADGLAELNDSTFEHVECRDGLDSQINDMLNYEAAVLVAGGAA